MASGRTEPLTGREREPEKRTGRTSAAEDTNQDTGRAPAGTKIVSSDRGESPGILLEEHARTALLRGRIGRAVVHSANIRDDVTPESPRFWAGVRGREGPGC